MRICIFSDVHWNTDSSIIRSRGEKYSIRLEHLIDSMNFVNRTALENNCDIMICAGDFFNKAQISDEEVTALRDINWNNLSCYFLCGNHESSVSDLRFNTLKTLESDNHYIISNSFTLTSQKCQIHFVPYILESDRKDLINYLGYVDKSKTQIIISHNDIQGIQYGGFESKAGFTIKEIEDNCDLYLNGHLHNSEFITKKILNVGSFSCHNFTNDASKYNYGIWILDTDTRNIEFIDNPYGFKFYKFNINNSKDLENILNIKNNAVVSVSCNQDLMQECLEYLDRVKNKIIERRITTVQNKVDINVEDKSAELHSIDHIKKLIEFCKENIDNTEILLEELAALSK